MDIVMYNEDYRNEEMDRFLDQLQDLELKFAAGSLLRWGFEDRHQIERAVEKAIRVCELAHISVNAHFRPVYISYKEEIMADWKLSLLAVRLILINSELPEEILARLQVEFLKGKI